jgi:hypothetical protein
VARVAGRADFRRPRPDAITPGRRRSRRRVVVPSRGEEDAMIDPSAVPAGAPEEGAGPLGLAVVPAILTSPGGAFRRLARDPQWIGPFAAAVVLVAIGAWIALPATLEFSAQTADATMSRMGLSDEQRAEALARMPDPDDRSPGVLLRNVGGSALAMVAFGFLGAGILHGIARLAGRTPTFRRTLALFSAGYVVSGLGGLVKSGLIAASGTVEVTLGPGALLGDLPFHSVPAILLDLFDVFSLWSLAVLTIGGAVLWGTTRKSAFAVCGTFWLVKAFFTVGGRLVGAWMIGAL